MRIELESGWVQNEINYRILKFIFKVVHKDKKSLYFNYCALE